MNTYEYKVRRPDDNIGYGRTFLISILLHLLLLLIPLQAFIAQDSEAKTEDKDKLENEMTFIFVETPDNAAESEVEQVTPYISDKNLSASNPEAPKNVSEGQPYQQGQTDLAAMIPEQTPGSASGMPATRGMPRSRPQEEAKTEEAKRESEPSEETTAQKEMTEYEALSRLAPRPKKEAPLIPESPQHNASNSRPGGPAIPPSPRFDNRNSRAPVGTGFSLSTYNWNWAPYLKQLKRKIEGNIYPPPAFYMGLASGRTFIRFTIMPDGTMTNFELLGFSGHESLKNTSANSIQSSAPFLPLPSDFPEDRLTITAIFSYNEYLPGTEPPRGE